MRTEHGSPFDRGSADSWYHRPRDPHKSGVGVRVPMAELTQQEVWEYHAGYDWNEQFGGKKDWD